MLDWVYVLYIDLNKIILAFFIYLSYAYKKAVSLNIIIIYKYIVNKCIYYHAKYIYNIFQKMSNSFLNTMAAAKTLNTLIIRFVFQRCLSSRENIGN